MAFYNKGQMRMAVTEEELLTSWKEFFGNGTNWKDLDRGITYKEYLAISDREHVKKILQMPVHFLQESGKGFFVQREGYALALREELETVIRDPVFVGHEEGDVEIINERVILFLKVVLTYYIFLPNNRQHISHHSCVYSLF